MFVGTQGVDSACLRIKGWLERLDGDAKRWPEPGSDFKGALATCWGALGLAAVVNAWREVQECRTREMESASR